MFSECNSKTGENINFIFNKLIKNIIMNEKCLQENQGKNEEKNLKKCIIF